MPRFPPFKITKMNTEEFYEPTLSEPEMLVMALALSKIQVSEKIAHLVILSYEGIKRHGGEFSIKHIANIQTEIEKIYQPESI